MTNVLPMRRPFHPTADRKLDDLTIRAMASVILYLDLEDDPALVRELRRRGFSEEAIDRYRDAAVKAARKRRESRRGSRR